MAGEHGHRYRSEHDHEHTHPDYPALIRGQGFRVTPQRQLILDAIHEGGGHLTLDEIHSRVQTKTQAINRATMYRTLDFLCALRLVATVEMGGHKLYEIVGEEPHHHLVCRSCGKVDQVSNSTLHSAFELINREQGFTVDMEHLVLLGLCTECREVGASS